MLEIEEGKKKNLIGTYPYIHYFWPKYDLMNKAIHYPLLIALLSPYGFKWLLLNWTHGSCVGPTCQHLHLSFSSSYLITPPQPHRDLRVAVLVLGEAASTGLDLLQSRRLYHPLHSKLTQYRFSFLLSVFLLSFLLLCTCTPLVLKTGTLYMIYNRLIGLKPPPRQWLKNILTYPTWQWGIISNFLFSFSFVGV